MLIGERPEEKKHPDFNPEASLEEARARMSFEVVLLQYGHGPRDGTNWKSFKCPFCQDKKKSAGLFKAPGGSHQLFKCQRTSCPTGAQAMDEIGFLALTSGINRKEAFQVYLKMAGVWRERTTLKPASKPKDTSPRPSPDIGVGSSPRLTPAGGEGEESDAVERVPTDEPTAEEIAATFADSGLSSPGTSDHPAVPQALEGDTSPQPSPQGGEGEEGNDSVPATADSSSLPVPPAGVSDDVPQTSDVPSNVVPLVAQPAEAPTAGVAGGATAGAEAKSEEATAIEAVVKPVEVVRAFYERLSWSEKDERACWEKRGLESRTCAALGFRSNPKANKALLQDLNVTFEEEVILESGLWVRDQSTGRPKPSGKFWGWGRKSKVVTFDEEGFPEKTVASAEVEYEQNEPILIPYFAHQPVANSRTEATHELISLRPHKDMGAKGTTTGHPHLYVPRQAPAPGETPQRFKREFFRTVVVTEGEFKAAAIWQIVGGGRKDGRKPLGVCALPGISFGRNYDLRQELEQFLRMCCAEHVVVVFDNEEKGDPKLPGFKPDWRKRHDAEIWARYMAEDVFAKLSPKTSRVGRIGNEWRDEKGKADWDGMMARMAQAVSP